MAILQKNIFGGGFLQKTVGQMGTWVDSQTGLGYSGPKRKETDIPYTTQVGNSQTLNKNPNIKKSVPIPQVQSQVQPQTQPQIANSQETIDYQSERQTIPQAQSSALGIQSEGSDPITKFNLAILDMLRKAQNSSGNENLYAQQTALQRAQIGRTSEITPEELRGLSPTQQSALRSGSADALSPEIDAISAKIKASDSRLQNFESILGQMRDIGMDIAKLNPSKEVLDGYKNMIEAGGQPSSVPEEIRSKVMGMIDWNKWQAATNKGKSDELTRYQTEQLENRRRSDFNSLVDKYNKSPLIAAADRTVSTEGLISTLEKDPGNRANQLIAIYQFIQILDNYQSAVREGEIGLLTGASSLQEKLQTSIVKLEQGQAVNPNVVLDITKGLKTLIKSINDAATRKSQQFRKQAEVGEIGDLWDNFTGGFESPYNKPNQKGGRVIEYQGKRYQTDANGEFDPNSPLTKAGNASASRIAAAIKTVESRGNYGARGESGEYGAYQFMPGTWKDWAGKFLGNPNAPMTPTNQDIVAQKRIQAWMDEGYNEKQIALLWNSNRTVPIKGVNSKGVVYDSGAYANKVLKALG